MKKIEMYLTDTEYEKLKDDIEKFEDTVMNNQTDNTYSDEEMAQIINASGSMKFYLSQGLKKQISEMENYINKYNNKEQEKSEPEKLEHVVKEEPQQKDNFKKQEFNIPQKNKNDKIKYETKTEEASDFDIM